MAKKNKETKYLKTESKSWRPSKKIADKATSILQKTGVKEGYAFYHGVGDGELLAALALFSKLHFIAIDPDVKKIEKLRLWFDSLGLYGERISLFTDRSSTMMLPPYIASLTVVGDENLGTSYYKAPNLQKFYRSMRPYGGKLWLPIENKDQNKIVTLLDELNLASSRIQCFKESIIVSRDGPLPGASDWNHQYGNIANTIKSDDQLVKMPLGLLWFGGNSNLDVLPRHGHGPPEQVVGGRLIIEGMDCISARDVYTGRVLWKTVLDSVDTYGLFYNETYKNTPLIPTYNQEHMPGANARGTNYVATQDYVYIVQGNSCLVLDITNGQPVNTIKIPILSDSNKHEWGYIGVSDDNLIGGSEFVRYSSLLPPDPGRRKNLASLSPKKQRKVRDYENYDITASKMLVVMDRITGAVKWQFPARYGFIHNAITAANGKIYCLDKLPAFYENKMQRRGLTIPDDYRLLAFDAETGKKLWEKNTDIFGSWLSYSNEFDVLLQATRPSRDMLSGEKGNRMIAYKVSDGTMLWDEKLSYNNPPILHHDRIITDKLALNILSGERIYRQDPSTEKEIPWTYTRTYGCNYNIASEHLLSFRSAAAGFYDLANDGGTGNFGGFKSGCTSNLVVANGVLNAPDYTRTCQCSYQNQTSLAFVHMPELEYWTNNDYNWDGDAISRIGLNLNAPGDRVDKNGTLWLDYPSIGGNSPDIPVHLKAEKPEYYRLHSLSLQSGEENWIAASGISADMEIEITLSEKMMDNTYYTVRLHFAELGNKNAGQRIFDVLLQDQIVLHDFDIAKEAGGTFRNITKTFQHIQVSDKLVVKSKTSVAVSGSKPLLCGIEIEKE